MDLGSSLVILLVIVMILTDMFGLMYWWSIQLNAVSLVNLVMAVGISVEFCSHITRAFAVSTAGDKVARAESVTVGMGSSVRSTVSGGYSDTTFWTVAWSFLRVQQDIKPHLKEGSLGYLLIQKS